MKVLIIRGTGFISQVVVRQLLERDCKVIIFHRGKTKSKFQNLVTEILDDRSNLSKYQNLFEKLKPDVVVDMIALIKEDAVNLIKTFNNIAEKVVIASSQDVYKAYGKFLGMEKGEPEIIPLKENSPLREKLFPLRNLAKDKNDWKYNYDKILIEKIVMQNKDLNWTILRLPITFGPEDRIGRINRIYEIMRKSSVIKLSKKESNWKCSRGYVENVALAIILSVFNKKANKKIFNVAFKQNFTLKEWIELIGKIIKWKGKVLVENKNNDNKFNHHLVVDTEKIRNELNYKELYDYRESIEKTVDWLKKLSN